MSVLKLSQKIDYSGHTIDITGVFAIFRAKKKKNVVRINEVIRINNKMTELKKGHVIIIQRQIRTALK